MFSISPILDVIIGLAGVFAAFSLLASWLNEQIATWLKWRSTFLLTGLKQILNGNDTAFTEFTGDPMFHALEDASGAARLHAPSYMSAQQFSSILMHALSRQQNGPSVAHLAAAPGAATAGEVLQAVGQMTPAYVNAVSAGAQAMGLDGQLNALVVRAGGDAATFVKSVEDWYDDGMDRVSGWYKRRVQIALFVIGCVLAVLFNIDSIRLYDGLMCNQALRASVSTVSAKTDVQANQYVENLTHALPLGWPAWPWDAHGLDRLPCTVNAPAAAATPMLGLNVPTALKLSGLLLTAIALSLGAPFWFDTLSRLTRVRNTGKKPDEPAAT